MKQIILLICSMIMVVTMSCKPDVQKVTKKTSPKITKAKASPKAKTDKDFIYNEKLAYWTNLKKNIGISANKVNKLKEETNKINKSIQELKDQKKWNGTSNKKTRDRLNNELKNKQLSILGTKKYNAKLAYDKFYKKAKKKK